MATPWQPVAKSPGRVAVGVYGHLTISGLASAAQGVSQRETWQEGRCVYAVFNLSQVRNMPSSLGFYGPFIPCW